MKESLIYQYAKQNYKLMFREPEGHLKHKFIVPGSVYDNCLWDWDSWLTNIALRQFVIEDISDYEKGCVLNFLEYVDEDGRIPIVITPDDFMPEPQQRDTNTHKPCLAQHAAFIIQQTGEAEWMRDYYSKLCRFVDYYILNCKHESGLYYWLDDLAIGVDNDPCTFFRPHKSSASIFLNCLMYKELDAICFIGKQLGYCIDKYKTEKAALKDAVQTHCYDEKDGFYYNVDLNLLPIDPDIVLHSGAPRHWNTLLQRISVWSGFLTMWSGIATQEQAARMVKENLLDEKSFWAPYGVRTLSKYEKMYTIAATGNPSCWLGPIWGISNFMVFLGLVKYGFDQEAHSLAERTVELFERDIRQCGQMHEYYHPETGQPVINPGFQNWNLLSINMIAWLKSGIFIQDYTE